jgi:hypothetical protein
MTEPSGHTPAISRALWIALAGHLLALIACATSSVPLNTAIAAAIAGSTIAMVALTELVPLDVRARRVFIVLTVGHGVAAAVVLAGVVPSVPRSLPLVGLAAAAALGATARVALRPASAVDREPRPLAMAPRVAAIALVVQALLHRWDASTASPSLPLRALIVLAIAGLGVALLASLTIIALRVRPRWAIAGLLAWTVGWVAAHAGLASLIVWSLGGPPAPGPHELRQLDPELVQIATTAGGLLIGAALVASIRDSRFRHSAVVLLAGYAAFGLIAAVTLQRIESAADFPSIVALREHRDLADAITAFALAGVLWLYWRRAVAPTLPRATALDD